MLPNRSASPIPPVGWKQQPHMPKAAPPPYICFTVPRFAFLPALEALLGLLFANLFWVGMWDTLDTTLFPQDSEWSMLACMLIGTLGMYFTDSLYDVLPDPGQIEHIALSRAPGEAYGATTMHPPSPQSASAHSASALRDAASSEEWLDGPGSFGTARDRPFIPPRFEIWRLTERVVANTAAVFIWVGIWDSIDDNILPVQCSYNACGRCIKYGQFPCAWYKILFTIVGLVGQFFTRGLYTDSEIAYEFDPAEEESLCCPCCRDRREKGFGGISSQGFPETRGVEVPGGMGEFGDGGGLGGAAGGGSASSAGGGGIHLNILLS